MASRTISDRGAVDTTIQLDRSGGVNSCAVTIRASDGREYAVAVDLAAALTGPERSQLLALALKLYNEGLARAGFA